MGKQASRGALLPSNLTAPGYAMRRGQAMSGGIAYWFMYSSLTPFCTARGHLSAAQVAAWLGVLTIVLVTRVVWCEVTGEESIEVSYFRSSLPPNARRIGSAIRGHWSIENG